jgi:hypothetical protein
LSPLAWLDAGQAYLRGWARANRIQFGRRVTRSQLNALTLLGTRNSQAAVPRGMHEPSVDCQRNGWPFASARRDARSRSKGAKPSAILALALLVLNVKTLLTG